MQENTNITPPLHTNVGKKQAYYYRSISPTQIAGLADAILEKVFGFEQVPDMVTLTANAQGHFQFKAQFMYEDSIPFPQKRSTASKEKEKQKVKDIALAFFRQANEKVKANKQPKLENQDSVRQMFQDKDVDRGAFPSDFPDLFPIQYLEWQSTEPIFHPEYPKNIHYYEVRFRVELPVIAKQRNIIETPKTETVQNPETPVARLSSNAPTNHAPQTQKLLDTFLGNATQTPTVKATVQNEYIVLHINPDDKRYEIMGVFSHFVQIAGQEITDLLEMAGENIGLYFLQEGNLKMPYWTAEGKVAATSIIGQYDFSNNKISWIREDPNNTLWRIKDFFNKTIDSIQNIKDIENFFNQTYRQEFLKKGKHKIALAFEIISDFKNVVEPKQSKDLGDTTPASELSPAMWYFPSKSSMPRYLYYTPSKKGGQEILFRVNCKFSGLNKIEDLLKNDINILTETEKLNPGKSFQVIVHELGHALMWKYFYFEHVFEYITGGKTYEGTLQEIITNSEIAYIDLLKQIQQMCYLYSHDNMYYNSYKTIEEETQGANMSQKDMYDIFKTEDFAIWFPKKDLAGEKISLANYFAYYLTRKFSPDATFWNSEALAYLTAPDANNLDKVLSTIFLMLYSGNIITYTEDGKIQFLSTKEVNDILVERRTQLLARALPYPH